MSPNYLVALMISAVRFYQRYRPYKTPNCRFHPTCSEYMIQALEKYGLLKGLYRGLGRVFRCHPFGKFGYDPVD
ncbi:MAG: membrane protein insertion efficiency factor YidD [bacterium]